MSSTPDENSPPRPDPVAKAKLQSSLLDSPSRVTRSQLRRLSNAPSDAPMSPKPTVTRRRSALISETRSDAGTEDEVSSVQDEADAVKPPQRTRRSTRRSFADAEDGPSLTRGSKLMSIQEDLKPNTLDDSKPVTRRTRASIKVTHEPEVDLVLPPTRRTRRSSISSVSSVTSNVVASPRRQTRSRKNLSPVPSPTFSEVSTLSELPEISPNAGKRQSGFGLNTSCNGTTPQSPNVSPAVHSSEKNSATRSNQLKDTSLMTKKGESPFTAVRQILVDVEGTPVTKRSSLSSPVADIINKPAETSLTDESESMKPPRKLSLSSRKSSPLKFTESPLKETGKNAEESNVVSNKSSDDEPSIKNVISEDEIDKSKRRSCERFSLSSNKSSPATKVGASPELSNSRRSSLGRLSLSSNKSSPSKLFSAEDIVNLSDDEELTASPTPVVLLTKSEEIEKLNSPRKSLTLSADRCLRESTGRLSWKSSPLRLAETPVNAPLEKSQFEVVDSVDGNKTSVSEDSISEDNVAEVSHRNSVGRVSLSSNKSTPVRPFVSDASPQLSVDEHRRNSLGRLSLSSNKSTPVKPSVSDASPQLSVDESRRNSLGRLSLSSKKSTPVKTLVSEDSPQVSLNDSRRNSLGRLSLSSNKSTPAKPSVSEDSLQTAHSEPQRNSMGRASLSSNKSTPAKPSISEVSPQVSVDESRRNSLERVSLSSNKSTPVKPSVSEDSLQTAHSEPQRNSMGRASLSSNKSTPAKPSISEVSPLIVTIDNEDSESMASSTFLTEAKDMPVVNLDVSCQSSSSENDNSIRESTGNDSLSEDIVTNSIKVPSFFNDTVASRRASTGNLCPGTGLKSQARASMGPLLNPLVSYMTSDDNEAMSDSSDCNEQVLETDGLKISPIKQATPALKRRSVTPSSDKSLSEPEQQLSPNNPFEKSTVFDEMDESFGTNSESIEGTGSLNTSHKSPKLILSESVKNNSTDGDILSEAVESSKKSPSPSKLSFNLNSVGVKSKLTSAYKDAAVLLSGGNISDFDDDDSDNDQWEPVFSPSTKTKKELRMEKKARKKAEKLARKKDRLEKKFSSILVKEQNLDSNDSASMDLVADEAKREFSAPVDELEMGDEMKPKGRKSLPQSNMVSPLKKSGTASPDKTDVVVLSDKKSQKRKSRDAELENCFVESSNVDVEAFKSEEVPESNKRKKLIQPVNNISPEESQDGLVSSGEKLKKKKKKIQRTSEQILSEETSSQISESNIKLLKKKKKQKLINGADLPNDENAGDSITVVKKKKIKKQISTDVNILTKDEPSTILKKKKKVKNSVDIEPSAIMGVFDCQTLAVSKTKKKLKKTLESEPGANLNLETVDAASKKKKLKKKVKILEPSVLEQNDESSVADIASHEVQVKKKKAKKLQVNGTDDVTIQKKMKVESNNIEVNIDSDLKRKKKKKKALVEIDENSVLDGHLSDLVTKKKLKKVKKLSVPIETGNASDSDDAPTSVSFSAGKSAALAELEAAAESIKKLKDLKRQKMQLKWEKIKEEKLAKMQRLKKKRKHDDNFEPDDSSIGGVDNGSSSSKIFLDTGYQKTGLKRLPAELLESLSEQPPTKLVKQPDGSKKRVAVAAVSAEEQEHLDKKRARKIALKLEKQRLLNSDYVPLDGVLGATRFGVVPLRNIMLAKKREKNRLAEEAANFRQQSLFGNRIRRTPISSMLAHQDKLKASGKDHKVASSK